MRSVVIILLFLCTTVKAQFVHSVQDGAWYDPLTWESGTVPNRTDSIWVSHILETDSSIHVDSSGYIMVDSLGALCIGDSLLFACGTYLYNDGYIAVRFIHVHDGWSANWITFGRLHATPCNGIGNFHMEGGRTGNVPCTTFIPSDSTPPIAYPAITVSLFPNPASDHIWVRVTQAHAAVGDERYRFLLYDMLGKELFNSQNLVAGDNWIPLPENLATGHYLWHAFPQVSIPYQQSGSGVLIVGE